MRVSGTGATPIIWGNRIFLNVVEGDDLYLWCVDKSKSSRHIVTRKVFYLFTCEYCFSHWVTAAFLFITRYKLLFPDWRGYLVSGFSLVWVANVYMSLFGHLRLEIREERLGIEIEETEKAQLAGASDRRAGWWER